MSAEQDAIMIDGREIILVSGAKVWGGQYRQSVAWKFTSASGAITRVTLSRDAIAAMVYIYQGLIGGDSEFVAVEFEASPVSAGKKP